MLRFDKTGIWLTKFVFYFSTYFSVCLKCFIIVKHFTINSTNIKHIFLKKMNNEAAKSVKSAKFVIKTK